MSNILEKYSEEDLIDVIENDKIDLDEGELWWHWDSIRWRKLYIDKVDKSLQILLRMITEGELILQPDYQRKFVRTKDTISVYRIYFSIPLPTIFWENDDDTLEVIDGQQINYSFTLFMESILNEGERVRKEFIQR